MARYKGLTLEQHQELGREMRNMHDQLTHYAVEVGNAYPKRIEAYKHIGYAIKQIDLARSILDGCLFQEHGDQATPKIYYGVSKERADKR